MAKHRMAIDEMNHEQSVGNLRQMVLALAGVPDDALYVAHVVPGGRLHRIEVRYDDQGVSIDPDTLPMRVVRMEARHSAPEEG